MQRTRVRCNSYRVGKWYTIVPVRWARLALALAILSDLAGLLKRKCDPGGTKPVRYEQGTFTDAVA